MGMTGSAHFAGHHVGDSQGNGFRADRFAVNQIPDLPSRNLPDRNFIDVDNILSHVCFSFQNSDQQSAVTVRVNRFLLFRYALCAKRLAPGVYC
jgi:hypothetical protein